MADCIRDADVQILSTNGRPSQVINKNNLKIKLTRGSWNLDQLELVTDKFKEISEMNEIESNSLINTSSKLKKDIDKMLEGHRTQTINRTITHSIVHTVNENIINCELMNKNSEVLQEINTLKDKNKLMQERINMLEDTITEKSNHNTHIYSTIERLDIYLAKLAKIPIVNNNINSISSDFNQQVDAQLNDKFEQVKNSMDVLLGDKDSLVRTVKNINQEINSLKSKLATVERNRCKKDFNKTDLDQFKSNIKNDLDQFKRYIKSDLDQFKSYAKNDLNQFKSYLNNDLNNFKNQVHEKNNLSKGVGDMKNNERLTYKYDKLKMRLSIIERDLMKNSTFLHNSDQALQNMAMSFATNIPYRDKGPQVLTPPPPPPVWSVPLPPSSPPPTPQKYIPPPPPLPFIPHPPPLPTCTPHSPPSPTCIPPPPPEPREVSKMLKGTGTISDFERIPITMEILNAVKLKKGDDKPRTFKMRSDIKIPKRIDELEL